jgi:uncharacterized membrane protein
MTAVPAIPSNRIATIDWMRGLVMVLMVIDQVSMAFGGSHDPKGPAIGTGCKLICIAAGDIFI